MTKHMWKTARTTAVIGIITVLSACTTVLTGSAPASFTVTGNTAVMNGVIDGSTPRVVETLLQNHPDLEMIVMIDVPGSINDEANLKAARLVRTAGLHTHIPADGDIASGGVDFYLAGTRRTMEPGAKFGVHSWAASLFSHESASELPRNHGEHESYLSYYREMGVPEDFYWFTLEAAPPDDIHYMTPEEIERYGFIN